MKVSEPFERILGEAESSLVINRRRQLTGAIQ